MIETKVKAGTTAGAITGLVVWALMAFVPIFHSGVPEPVVAVIPFVLAWAGHTIAAYRAPHTNRPDLHPGAVPTRLAGTVRAQDGVIHRPQPPP